MGFTLEDDKGRELLVVNDNGQFAFSRFLDLGDGVKYKLIEMYMSLSGRSSNEFVNFLNFKDKRDKFCS